MKQGNEARKYPGVERLKQEPWKQVCSACSRNIKAQPVGLERRAEGRQRGACMPHDPSREGHRASGSADGMPCSCVSWGRVCRTHRLTKKVQDRTCL